MSDKKRGRPAIDPIMKRDQVVTSRLTVQEMLLLTAFTHHEKQSMSDVVRMLLVGCLSDNEARWHGVSAGENWIRHMSARERMDAVRSRLRDYSEDGAVQADLEARQRGEE